VAAAEGERVTSVSLIVPLKIIHVFAAITAVGANLTYTYWLRYAGLDHNRLAWTLKGISRLDNFIATPAYIVLFITGFLMVIGGAFSFQTGWIAAAIALYVVVVVVGVAFYSPALRRQIAEAEADPRSPAYASIARRTNLFGVITTLVVLIIVVLMVAKPF
jgi:uncharacterized membrane protein